MRYPVVLLDVGETLVGPRESFGAVYARVFAPLGLDLGGERFDSALREAWDEFDRTLPEGKDRYRHFPGGERGYWIRFVENTLEKATGAPPRDRFAELALGALGDAFRRADAWKVYPDVVPALDLLQGAGARLAVVSNWDSRLPEILDLLELSHYFETVVVSHFEGMEKPDPALFRIALERMGVSPDQAIHVGDRPDLDLAGARAAGVDCVLVDRRGRIDPSPGVIRDLGRLPRIVRDGLGDQEPG